jgi:glycosyltransferase involved in cell wall biosynthesis
METHSNPFLSICIPTFNRSVLVYNLVKNILKHQGDDIEVVVLDNCSSDNSGLLLNSIEDIRFKYLSNEINIGGILNPIKVLTKGRGNFSILCLDKDNIDYENISTLISKLKEDKDVVFGYCALDLDCKSQDVIFEKGFHSVLNMAYLSKHPSGYFYKTDIYNGSETLAKIFTEKIAFAFNLDLINAEISFNGKSKIINLPIFYTEKRTDCAKIPSFTYNKDNLYFEPQNRFLEYFTYMKNASELKILKDEKLKIIISLYNRGLITSTILYKSILADQNLCSHHGIEKRKINIAELMKIDFNYSHSFLKISLPISKFKRVLICLRVHVAGFVGLLRNK